MNLSIHPLVLRAKIRAALANSADIAFQFESNKITVFLLDEAQEALIPPSIEGMLIKIVYYKKAM